MLIEKAASLFWCRQFTCLFLPEPFVTMFGDDIIAEIAERLRDDFYEPEPAPVSIQSFRNPDGCVGFDIRYAVSNQDDAVDRVADTMTFA